MQSSRILTQISRDLRASLYQPSIDGSVRTYVHTGQVNVPFTIGKQAKHEPTTQHRFEIGINPLLIGSIPQSVISMNKDQLLHRLVYHASIVVQVHGRLCYVLCLYTTSHVGCTKQHIRYNGESNSIIPDVQGSVTRFFQS